MHQPRAESLPSPHPHPPTPLPPILPHPRRAGAPLPASQALRFPLPTDMPPDFYRALEAGQPLELAAAPHLAGRPPGSPAQRAQQHASPGWEAQRGGRSLSLLAAAAPLSPLGRAQRSEPGACAHAGAPCQARQQPATPATGGGSAAGHAPAAAAGAAVQGPHLPPLVPVRLQLAGPPNRECSEQSGGDGDGGEAIVVGRSFLRAHAGDVAGLLRLLCEQCEAPPGREVRPPASCGLPHPWPALHLPGFACTPLMCPAHQRTPRLPQLQAAATVPACEPHLPPSRPPCLPLPPAVGPAVLHPLGRRPAARATWRCCAARGAAVRRLQPGAAGAPTASRLSGLPGWLEGGRPQGQGRAWCGGTRRTWRHPVLS